MKLKVKPKSTITLKLSQAEFDIIEFCVGQMSKNKLEQGLPSVNGDLLTRMYSVFYNHKYDG